MGLKRIPCLLFVSMMGILGVGCAATQQELHSHDEIAPIMMNHAGFIFIMAHSEGHVYSLAEIPEDEPCKNIYGDHLVILLPNLLVADNQLKLMEICIETKKNEYIPGIARERWTHLSRSLGRVKTQWGYLLKKEFEEKFQKTSLIK
jgi:hypothetical protein